jgi:hypothetical protein
MGAVGVEVQASARGSRINDYDLHLHAVFRPVPLRALERVVVLDPSVKEDLDLARAHPLCVGDGNLEGWTSQKLPRRNNEGTSWGLSVINVRIVKVLGEALRLSERLIVILTLLATVRPLFFTTGRNASAVTFPFASRTLSAA